MKEKQFTRTELKPMHEWLEEYTKKNVANKIRGRFQKYLAWIEKTPKQLVSEYDKHEKSRTVKQWQRETRNLIHRYQTMLMEKGYSQNTVRTMVNAVRAFFTSQCESVKKLKVVSGTVPKDEHTFSLMDLKQMHAVANTEDKAILSLACSLGWHSRLFLNLQRDFVESQINRAKSQKQDFIAFDWQRVKTGEPIYGVITPLAMHCCEQYIAKDNPQGKLFQINEDTLNNRLKNLVKEANIQTTGEKVSFKLIRKWLMQSLDEANLTEFQVKIIVGKHIPSADSTYLQRLKRVAFENYRKAYPNHLSLSMDVNGNAKYNELTDLVVKHVKAQQQLISYMENQGMLKDVPAQIGEQLKTVFEFARIMEKKNGEKPNEKDKHQEETEA